MPSSSSLELGGADYDQGSESSMSRHCYQNRVCYSGCGSVLAIVLIIILSMSWDTLEPTQYGLLKNGMTGFVDLSTVYSNGRHFIGPAQHFIVFPANLVTLSYGDRSADDQREIRARAGAGAGTDSSGGQPVVLSLSFQYRLQRDSIASLYTTFGEQYEASFLRFAQQSVTNIAQGFTPSMFWRNRRSIEAQLLTAVNHSLATQGFAHVPALQLRSVGFQPSYEQTITNIQLQEQLRVTKSYQLEVTRVQKQVDLREAETTAEVVTIDADAARQQAIIIGEANAEALQLEQRVKADMYQRLREHLRWSTTEFLQYVKQRALNRQPQANVVVGVDAVGGVPP